MARPGTGRSGRRRRTRSSPGLPLHSPPDGDADVIIHTARLAHSAHHQLRHLPRDLPREAGLDELFRRALHDPRLTSASERASVQELRAGRPGPPRRGLDPRRVEDGPHGRGTSGAQPAVGAGAAPCRGRGDREWDPLSAHSLRHTAITMALDAGVALRDVQDYARHREARTTRRYDHSRDSLDRNAVYAVAAYLS